LRDTTAAPPAKRVGRLLRVYFWASWGFAAAGGKVEKFVGIRTAVPWLKVSVDEPDAKWMFCAEPSKKNERDSRGIDFFYFAGRFFLCATP
jgi:hypothetical protein